MRRRRSFLPLFASLFLLAAPGLLAAPASAVVEIEWVPVGAPGNLPDSSDNCEWANCGYVAQVFRISKYEITNAQYVEFLNAVANEFDPFRLFDPIMSGIEFPPVPIGFERFYEVRHGFANKPVDFVSNYDAMRFANWLHNGQGGADTESGAYTLVGGIVTPIDGTMDIRNPGANVFLPTENEWYKAAYYHPGLGIYLDYPSGSNATTLCSAPAPTPNQANCSNAVGGVTDVGAYTGSASPFGTFDQGGNLWELTENFVLRGGSYFNPDSYTSAATGKTGVNPFFKTVNVGFRLASPVPEPDASLLAATVLASLAALRRMQRGDLRRSANGKNPGRAYVLGSWRGFPGASDEEAMQ